MISSIILLAQETGTAYAMKMSGVHDTGQISVLSLFLKGGYILFPIVLLSIVSVYLIVRKWLDIKNSLNIDQGMVSHMNSLLRAGDLKSAEATLKNDNSSYANIFRHVIGKIGKPVREIESTIETASNIEIARVSKNLGYLGLIAGIAPMLGFIGTISGVIKIFYNISLADNISIGIIAGGLYQKMICSGTGLIVGVIAYTAYHYLQMMIDRFSIDMQRQVNEVVKVL